MMIMYEYALENYGQEVYLALERGNPVILRNGTFYVVYF